MTFEKENILVPVPVSSWRQCRRYILVLTGSGQEDRLDAQQKPYSCGLDALCMLFVYGVDVACALSQIMVLQGSQFRVRTVNLAGCGVYSDTLYCTFPNSPSLSRFFFVQVSAAQAASLKADINQFLKLKATVLQCVVDSKSDMISTASLKVIKCTVQHEPYVNPKPYVAHALHIG
jgi:hypothetical protein